MNKETPYTAEDARRLEIERNYFKDLAGLQQRMLKSKDEEILNLRNLLFLSKKRAEREATRATQNA